MEVFEKKITSDVKFIFIRMQCNLLIIIIYNRQNQRDQRPEIRELKLPILIYHILIYQRIMSQTTRNKINKNERRFDTISFFFLSSFFFFKLL